MKLTSFQQSRIRGHIRACREQNDDREHSLEVACSTVEIEQHGEVRALFERYWEPDDLPPRE